MGVDFSNLASLKLQGHIRNKTKLPEKTEIQIF